MIFYLTLPFGTERKTSLYISAKIFDDGTDPQLLKSLAGKRIWKESHKATSKYQATEPFDFLFCKHFVQQTVTGIGLACILFMN